jgi:type I site-specific restriction-modification system R (restriction) subunit
MKRLISSVIFLALMSAYCSAQTKPIAETANEDVIATVLGKKLTVKDKDNLNGQIFGALLDNFAKENKIEPTDQEVDTFVLKLEEKQKQSQVKWEQDREQLLSELKSTSLSEKERKEKESRLQTIERILKTTLSMKEQIKGKEAESRARMRPMAQQFVKNWKINKALYAKYGGRIIFQQAGVEPLDAYRDFLKEQEKNGSFQIVDKTYEAPFWRYYTNESMHHFYSGNDGATFINTPWWMMEKQPGN